MSETKYPFHLKQLLALATITPATSLIFVNYKIQIISILRGLRIFNKRACVYRQIVDRQLLLAILVDVDSND